MKVNPTSYCAETLWMLLGPFISTLERKNGQMRTRKHRGHRKSITPPHLVFTEHAQNDINSMRFTASLHTSIKTTHTHTHTHDVGRTLMLPLMLLYLKPFKGCGILKVKKRANCFNRSCSKLSFGKIHKLDRERLFYGNFLVLAYEYLSAIQVGFTATQTYK